MIDTEATPGVMELYRCTNV